ncbi:hypothetical protein SLEP1_g52130 [Rubroshorea leprosula]|uniref:Uncharacterized protein n=1 Tax=Rubroshorea leprosula TaxID=152421 RepID=A0AAV5M5D6_9ROSI|nr:hypothetical protein SLEP1_g52130 [Rubroshorea leprosula]
MKGGSDIQEDASPARVVRVRSTRGQRNHGEVVRNGGIMKR